MVNIEVVSGRQRPHRPLAFYLPKGCVPLCAVLRSFGPCRNSPEANGLYAGGRFRAIFAGGFWVPLRSGTAGGKALVDQPRQ